mmetsp:Transcript_17504/g.37732  ORF Transcript_17504/g.37732 Transcript_17504/m.37732 type:complete len:224 (+) Transcript_17504:3-674(+)
MYHSPELCPLALHASTPGLEVDPLRGCAMHHDLGARACAAGMLKIPVELSPADHHHREVDARRAEEAKSTAVQLLGEDLDAVDGIDVLYSKPKLRAAATAVGLVAHGGLHFAGSMRRLMGGQVARGLRPDQLLSSLRLLQQEVSRLVVALDQRRQEAGRLLEACTNADEVVHNVVFAGTPQAAMLRVLGLADLAGGVKDSVTFQQFGFALQEHFKKVDSVAGG